MEEVLELVEPSLEYKLDALAFLEEVKKEDKGLDWQYAGMARLEQYENNYEEWVKAKKEEKKGINLPDNYVPASTYFCIRVSDNKIIGMVNIRHKLNSSLQNTGGHIGYSIRPSERNKGYGVIQLKNALKYANKLGITSALVTCDERNIRSKKTIKRCYGKQEKSFKDEKNGNIRNRFIIDTTLF